jgi:hypothetical protein
MADFDVLAQNNSHLVRLTSLTGPASSAIDSSTGVTATFYNAAGDEVTGGSTWPVNLVATTSSANDYQATISSTGYALTINETGECVVTVDAGGFAGEFVRPLRFQKRSA